MAKSPAESPPVWPPGFICRLRQAKGLFKVGYVVQMDKGMFGLNRRQFLLAGLVGTLALPVLAGERQALVAVAANFARVAEQLLPGFEAETGYSITLSSGSSGQIYGQIVNGAPYDAFLSADQQRPALLEQAGRALRRLTYARGALALWRPGELVDEDSLRGQFAHLAMANPALAPYGRAAKDTLTNLGLWGALQPRIVLGQNIGQAYALVASGNASIGLVARSQLRNDQPFWAVPEALYQPILQDAVLLTQNPAAAAFLAYLESAPARTRMRDAGYIAI